MKYIIEIEDEPMVRGEDEVWKAKGFRSLVFDQNGLDKLKPYKKPDRNFRVGDEVMRDGESAYVIVPENDEGEMVLLMKGYACPQYASAPYWKKTGHNSSTIRNMVLKAKLSMDKEGNQE